MQENSVKAATIRDFPRMTVFFMRKLDEEEISARKRQLKKETTSWSHHNTIKGQIFLEPYLTTISRDIRSHLDCQARLILLVSSSLSIHNNHLFILFNYHFSVRAWLIYLTKIIELRQMSTSWEPHFGSFRLLYVLFSTPNRGDSVSEQVLRCK